MWRDHRVKSARRREKGVRSLLGWMRRDRDEMMHHCQPHPTVRTRSFNNGVQKERWEWNHPSFTKVCSSTLLPPRGHSKYLFQKKRKKWGVFQRYAWDLLSEGNRRRHRLSPWGVNPRQAEWNQFLLRGREKLIVAVRHGRKAEENIAMDGVRL